MGLAIVHQQRLEIHVVDSGSSSSTRLLERAGCCRCRRCPYCVKGTGPRQPLVKCGGGDGWRLKTEGLLLLLLLQRRRRRRSKGVDVLLGALGPRTNALKAVGTQP